VPPRADQEMVRSSGTYRANGGGTFLETRNAALPARTQYTAADGDRPWFLPPQESLQQLPGIAHRGSSLHGASRVPRGVEGPSEGVHQGAEGGALVPYWEVPNRGTVGAGGDNNRRTWAL
jgi:hypothetical protein